VQITDGQFAGVVGRIKRVRGNRCVVIPIGKEMAVGVMDVPKCHLRYMTDKEVKALEE
jgi:transcription antitermination factor NusG